VVGGDDDAPHARLTEACDEVAEQFENRVELRPCGVEHP